MTNQEQKQPQEEVSSDEGKVSVTVPLSQVSIREESPFSVTLKGNLIYEISGADRILKITLEIEPSTKSPERETFEMQPISLDEFPSPDDLFLFLQDLKRNFFETLRSTMIDEGRFNLRDTARFLVAQLELAPISKERIINDHLEATRYRLAYLLEKLPEKPPNAKWTKHTLERAVKLAARIALRNAKSDPENNKFNIQAVCDEMRKTYGDDTPASGDALRKVLDEFKISWSKIKSEVRRYEEFR